MCFFSIFRHSNLTPIWYSNIIHILILVFFSQTPCILYGMMSYGFKVDVRTIDIIDGNTVRIHFNKLNAS